MLLQINKTVHENPYLDNVDKYGDHYKFTLSNGNNELGKLIYRPSKNNSFIEIDNSLLTVVTKRNFFSRNKLSLVINEPNNETLGKIERTKTNIFSKFTYSITLGDITYFLAETVENISLSSLRKSARGEKSFTLSSYTMTATISLKIVIPTIQLGDPTITLPFQASVETTEENRLLFLCAAYLIQKHFEDTSNV